MSDGESDWKALKEHYNEAVALLENAEATSSEAAELLEELPVLIAAVKPAEPETTTVYGDGIHIRNHCLGLTESWED